MNSGSHERAFRLIDTRLIEGISAADHEWLEGHLADCPACQARATASERSLQALRSNSVAVGPELVSATQARVRWRARQLRDDQARLRALWISCGLSWLMGTLTAPLLWEALAWLGRNLDIPRAVWITVFGLCWLAPATLVGGIIAWRYSRASGAEVIPGSWEHRG